MLINYTANKWLNDFRLISGIELNRASTNLLLKYGGLELTNSRKYRNLWRS